jgi:hypothetical protein
MLGVRRAEDTEAAQTLQSRGLIRHRRGVPHIMKRVGVERIL